MKDFKVSRNKEASGSMRLPPTVVNLLSKMVKHRPIRDWLQEQEDLELVYALISEQHKTFSKINAPEQISLNFHSKIPVNKDAQALLKKFDTFLEQDEYRATLSNEDRKKYEEVLRGNKINTKIPVDFFDEVLFESSLSGDDWFR